MAAASTITATPGVGQIQARAQQLKTVRDLYMYRARDYSKVTIPYLVPETNQTDSTEFQNDYNTEGAKLVNALGNAYAQSLFPAGEPFIKLGMDPLDMKAVQAAGQRQAKLTQLFSSIERNFAAHFETVGSRAAILDAMLQLIVAGNYCLYKPKDGNLMGYAIDEYYVMRSLDGTLLELITEDYKLLPALDPELQAAVVSALHLEPDDTSTKLTLYTYVRRDPQNPDTWYVDQAVETIPVGEQNTYKTDGMRWMPLMWTRTRREMYGRGLVESHYGSFWTLSILSEALAVGCVSMADIKYLVRPGSVINVPELNSSASGTYHYGEPDDINAITTNRTNDFRLITDVIQMYVRHLSEVFMYLPGTMRNAERVTAEENRLRAASLEKAHGGVYSQLADSLQKPYAKLLLSEMNVKNLEQAGVNIEIVTGLGALTRGSTNDRIVHWLADMSGVNNLSPTLQQVFKMSDFARVTAAGRDVDASTFILDDAQQAQAQQMAQNTATQGVMGQELAKKADPKQLAQAMQAQAQPPQGA
jgi:hypothetical protein